MVLLAEGLHRLGGGEQQKQRRLVFATALHAQPQDFVLYRPRLNGKVPAGKIDEPLLLIAQAMPRIFLIRLASFRRWPVSWTKPISAP